MFLAALALFGALVFSSRALPGLDGWFHARYADLLRRGVISWDGSQFPWHAHSAYADFPMDWSLGWHWLLAPLTAFAAPLTALKIAVAVFAATLVTVFHVILRHAGVRRPILWTVLLLVGSPGWLLRAQYGRPTTLVIAGLLALLWATLERRAMWAGAVSLVLMLLYHVPATPLLVGGLACVGLLAEDRRIPWRVGLSILAGVGLAVLVHPGFWSLGDGGFFSLDHATLHLWGLMGDSMDFASREGHVLVPGEAEFNVPLPAELVGTGVGTLFTELRIALIATVVAVGLAIRARGDRWVVATALLAAVCLAATVRSLRFFEYWHPFAVLACAVAVGRGSSWLQLRRAKLVSVAALALVAVSELPFHLHVLRHGTDGGGHDVRAAAESLRGRAEPDDVVFHGSWDDFAPLFHWNPDVRWLTGFDPWYLVAHDPRDAAAHGAAGLGRYPTADALRGALRERLGARFVLLWKRAGREHRYDDFERQLRDVPWAELIHDDPATVVFELR